jgi:hypothetical protein
LNDRQSIAPTELAAKARISHRSNIRPLSA